MNPQIGRVDDLTAGTSRELKIPWPAAFDASGQYLYSPSWAVNPKGEPAATTIVDATSGDLVAQLSGAPLGVGIDLQPRVLGRSQEGYVIALQGADGCDGTAVYRQGVEEPQCIKGGAAGVVSANGRFVAVARLSGQIGRAYGPGFETIEMDLYDLDIVDVNSGAVRTVWEDAPSFAPMTVAWNDAGTHRLVLWPRSPGL